MGIGDQRMPRPFSGRRGRCHQAHWHKLTSLFLIALAILVLRVFIEGTIPSRFSGSDQEANLAFFVQVSNTSVLNLPRLLKAIWHEQNVYVIHFDVKIGNRLREKIIGLLNQDDTVRHGNVIVMESEAISYAGITMLLNTINGMSRLLHISPSWDFFVNLSGSDYPLMSAETMRKVLGSAPIMTSQLNFLQAQVADKDMDWFFDRRMKHVHIDTALWAGEGNSLSIQEHESKSLEDGMLINISASHPVNRDRASFVKTEGWVILHRSFCEYAVNSALARRLLVSFATARAADELFFGTLLTKSKRFRSTIAWDGLRYILWGIHGMRWSRPAFLDQVAEKDEIRSLVTHSGALFARKFALPDSALLDHIDANMSGITEREWEVNETSMQQHTARVRKRLLCIADGRVVGVPCQAKNEMTG